MDIDKILDKADEDRYYKGQNYYKQNRVKNGIIYNNYLIAEVIGSDIYRIKIKLGKNPEFNCTCPDNANYCKHIIAVLLMYKYRKEWFVDFDKLLSDLGKKDKQELLNIIKQMYLNKIDLISILKINNFQIKEINDFSKDIYGVEDLFVEYVHYEEMSNLIKKLDSIITISQEFSEKKDFISEFAVLWSLIRTISNKIGDCDDSDGQIGELFFECVQGFSKIINKVLVEKYKREKFYHEVLTLWEKNDFGIEDGFLDIIEETATGEDSDFLIEEIKKIISKNKSKYFIEYKKEDLEELISHLKELKNGKSL
ncbi:SWIM zinc finger family protein [Candidatus Pacearchaeota archaeon]|nr:hypothetical protein [uncultured archaeon]MBS3078850.1 SWIM zinc finger family protein [Candidatus Pacearchaeota archaeon]